MSVKISRREEKRATPLRDFLLAATLPLLLCGVLGYLFGKADGVNTAINRSEVEEMQALAQQLQDELAERDRFINAVDSLSELLISARDARKDEFTQIVAQGAPEYGFGQDPFATWTKNVRRDLTEHSQSISELEGSVAGRGIVPTERLQPVSRLYEYLIDQCAQYFNDQRRTYQAMTEDERRRSESIADQEEALDDQLSEVEEELKQARRKLEIKDERINLLTSQITQSGAAPDPISFQTEKAAIKQATTQIEAISKQLPTGVVGKKKVSEIEAEILLQIGLIENALEVIE